MPARAACGARGVLTFELGPSPEALCFPSPAMHSAWQCAVTGLWETEDDDWSSDRTLPLRLGTVTLLTTASIDLKAP
jgi:hypothetical protein